MDAMFAVACASAAVCGFCLTVAGSKAHAGRERRRQAVSGLKGADGDGINGVGPAGASSPVVRAILRQAREPPGKPGGRFSDTAVWGLGLGDVPRLLARAGLAGEASPAVVREVRAKATLFSLAAGALAGGVFTPELAAAFGLAGALAGYACVPMALRAQASARNADMERHLAEMVEVVVLGLQSGLSFERSFLLYPRYFDTGLARSMERVARQWETGLASREDALRMLEAEYDSALLSRVVGSMVRSLRFGTSITDSLEAAAAEAREAHRARMEERVAKVAVKMMLPVGALILPAMLLLVMGPVLLELAEGF